VSSVTGSIDDPIENDLFAFTVTDGETASILVEKLSGGITPSWRLLDADGTPAPDCGTYSTASSRDCGPLAGASNPYRVEVIDNGRNDTGTYSVQLLGCNPVAVGDPPAPRVTHLYPAAPNPFNPHTRLSFDVAEPGQVVLRIYDASGQPVRTLHDGFLPIGSHQRIWNGRDDAGRGVATGVYFARMVVAGQPKPVQKLVLLK
jgi:hypothetical protein